MIPDRSRPAAASRAGWVAVGLIVALAAGPVRAQEPPPDQLPLTPPPAAGDAKPAGTIDPTEFEKLFDDAMKRREETTKKKEEDDARKKKEAAGHEVGSDLTLRASWRNGVWLETAEKDFQYHIGGTLHYDFTWFTAGQPVQFGPGGVGRLDDGFAFRRGRIRAEGLMWEVVDFVFELEFFNAVLAAGSTTGPAPVPDPLFNSPGPTDGYMTLRHLPVVGNLRLGWHKEPFSLEAINSHRFLEFLERSYLFDATQTSAFNNGRGPGASVFNTWLDDRVWGSVGFFRNVDNLSGFGVGDGDYAVTARLTGLPVYENDGETLVHVGGAISHRNPVEDSVRLRARPLIRNAPTATLVNLADTGRITATEQNLYNLQSAAVFGPLTLQAEYTAAVVHNGSTAAAGPVGDLLFYGYYAEALYFLTGEHRGYDKKLARWDRVVPHEPFYLVGSPCGPLRGSGAWEVGARYSYLDLTDNGVFGGVLHTVTLGVNWYLNPNAKLQVNYDITRRGDTNTPADGVIQALGVRMAYDF